MHIRLMSAILYKLSLFTMPEIEFEKENRDRSYKVWIQ